MHWLLITYNFYVYWNEKMKIINKILNKNNYIEMHEDVSVNKESSNVSIGFKDKNNIVKYL